MPKPGRLAAPAFPLLALFLLPAPASAGCMDFVAGMLNRVLPGPKAPPPEQALRAGEYFSVRSKSGKTYEGSFTSLDGPRNDRTLSYRDRSGRTRVLRLAKLELASLRVGDPVQDLLSGLPKPQLEPDHAHYSVIDPERVRPAVEAALKARFDEGRPLPEVIRAKASYDIVAFDAAWASSVEQAYRDVPSYGTPQAPVELGWVKGGGSSAISSVMIGGKRWYFRPVRDGQWRRQATVVRRTVAVGRLNAMLRLDTAPSSRMVRINGILGSLDADVGGSMNLGQHVDEGSLADTRAFEFLVAGDDVHLKNYRVSAKGRIRVFDHDKALHPGIPMKTRGYPITGRLPERYTRHFVQELRSLGPEDIRRELGGLLSPDELEGVIFRREVILQDIARRGAAAIF